jgi:hypothetical protein
MRAWLAGCLLVLVIVGADLAVAQAPRDLPAQVLVVLAKEEPGPVDPALRDEPALRRPPFNAFRSMEILEKTEVRLQVGRPSELTLPNGRKLQLTVERVMPDGRFRVKVSINRPNQSDYLPLLQVVASPGDPFFVAGQSHQGGTLVIGVRIGEKPAK